ncbi:methyltransferase GidB [Hyphomicrobium nitrativorans NL23]|uniref:Ribosomal RNA small subunit methyltransferase G n=1 Tax=Hyphomicrobium nitrativorans NL23 TaxID=1029756 RepID=V5SAH1_9HYPH|nr:16S rRNA (guanine(527)-N(7))-methyltransferase RsmG [Hyphomicrobium nitrativorans]AHB47437.1 methyltransferase GidB [Hyphomicrobium nitrativorans NL23]
MSEDRPRIRSAEAFREVFGVSRETADRLKVYEALLRTWQRTINLVSPMTLDDAWHRHFADSAQLLNFSPPDAKNWLDFGSGAGFPGLVLAILLAERAPEAHMTLVESDSRKAAFLREVARKTGAAVEIRVERIENTATQANSRIRDAITARALAPLPKLLGLVLPFFSPQTVAVFPKGREAEVEVGEAKRRFDFDSQLVPSLTDAEARIVIVRNLAVKTEG